MVTEPLQLWIFYATGTPRPELQEMLRTLPEVRVMGQAANPGNFLSHQSGAAPEQVIIDLAEETTLPPWLEDFAHSLPRTALMILSSNRDPDLLIRAMNLGIREFVSLPLVRADLETTLERVRATKRKSAAKSRGGGRIVAVAGLRGGVGTTSVAVNLSVALASRWPQRVILVDLGRPFADVGKFLDQKGEHCLVDLAQNVNNLDATFILRTTQPYGDKMAVLHGCPNFNDLEHVDLDSLDKVWDSLRGLFDWIVVDLGNWLDDLYMRVVEKADQALVITELTIPDLQNLRKLRTFMRSWGLESEKIRVVVNRFHKGNDLGLEDVERIQQRPVFFTLPSDYPTLIGSINHGVPLAESAPRSRLHRSLEHLTAELVAHSLSASPEKVVGAPRKRFWFF